MDFCFVVVDKKIGFGDVEGFLVLKNYFFKKADSCLWGWEHVGVESFFGEFSFFRLVFGKVFGFFSIIKLEHDRFTLILSFYGIYDCTSMRVFTEAIGWHLSEIEFGPGDILAFAFQAINAVLLDEVFFEELVLDFFHFVHDLVVAHGFILEWSWRTFFVVFLSWVEVFWVKFILKCLFLTCHYVHRLFLGLILWDIV